MERIVTSKPLVVLFKEPNLESIIRPDFYWMKPPVIFNSQDAGTFVDPGRGWKRTLKIYISLMVSHAKCSQIQTIGYFVLVSRVNATKYRNVLQQNGLIHTIDLEPTSNRKLHNNDNLFIKDV